MHSHGVLVGSSFRLNTRIQKNKEDFLSRIFVFFLGSENLATLRVGSGIEGYTIHSLSVFVGSGFSLNTQVQKNKEDFLSRILVF
mgnify:CR=1 FL=1